MATKPHKPARAKSTRTLEARRSAFLKALAVRGVVTAACEAARYDKHDAYAHRANDPAFESAWKQALEDFADMLETEATRRAVEGWFEPVFQGGEQVGRVKRFDSQLLQLMLRAKRPGQYRDRVEHSGPDGSALNLGPNVLVVRRVVRSEPAPAETSRLAPAAPEPSLTNGNGNGNGHAGH